MSHKRLWTHLLVTGVIYLTLADEPDTSSSSEPQKVNQLSWQSAFMGLVPLALNSMTQPSTLDVTFPQSNLLFPARSSPIICLYDSLWIITELFYYMAEGKGIRDAALRTSWDRAWARLGTGVTAVEENPGEKHPKTFAILFIGTFLQALKLWGVRGLFWTKVWAGMYISSYLVVAGLGYLARSNWTDKRPHPLQRTDKYSSVVPWGVTSIAMAFHIFLCMWTIHCLFGVDFSTSSVVGVFYAILKFPVCLALFVGCISIWAFSSGFSAMALYRAISVIFGREASDYGTGKGLALLYMACLMLTLGMVAFGTGFKISTEDMPYFFWRLGDVVVQGGGILLLGFSILSGFFPGQQSIFVAFAFANFWLAFLYYRFRFDPTGTEKPAWTDNLG